MFGGELDKTDSYTLYAGSLDDPSAFHPTFAIFAEGRPPWAIIPPGFKVFDRDAALAPKASQLDRFRTRSGYWAGAQNQECAHREP